MNQMKIINVSPNFAPPAGNAVAFSGTATLQHWDGNQWQNLLTVQGTGIYGDTLVINFPTVSTTRLRLFQITTSPGSHNPGFDEIEVYNNIPQVIDLEAKNMSFQVLPNTPPEMIVSLQVNNLGNTTVNSGTYNVRYQISGQTMITEVGQQDIPPGDSIIHVFNTQVNLIASPSPLASENICGFVGHPNDEDTSKNSLCEFLTFLSAQEDVMLHKSLKIFPNPSSGSEIKLSYPNYVEKIQIINQVGAVVEERKVQDALIDFSLKHQLKSGTYFILLHLRNGQYEVGTCVINQQNM